MRYLSCGTRGCVEELHVFVDRDSQCTGEYAQHEPLAALAGRWTRDARKLSASERLADLKRDEEPTPIGDAARPAGTMLDSGWERCGAQPHEGPDLEHGRVRPPSYMPKEETARMRVLAQELAAMGTPARSPEPADGREPSDGLGLELDFE